MRRHLSGSGPPLIGDQSADPRPARNTPADQGERAGTERMRTLGRSPPWPLDASTYDAVVPSPGDYLELTPAQARAQWRSILARSPRPDIPGFRQVPFTPVETLLCLAAMAVVDHHHYGGSTNHLSPSPIPELAMLFQRTRASILAKQANLDGSRVNGARHEIESA